MTIEMTSDAIQQVHECQFYYYNQQYLFADLHILILTLYTSAQVTALPRFIFRTKHFLRQLHQQGSCVIDGSWLSDSLYSCSIQSHVFLTEQGVSHPLTSLYGRRENDVDPARSGLPVGSTQICCSWIICQLLPPLHLTSFSFLRS